MTWTEVDLRWGITDEETAHPRRHLVARFARVHDSKLDTVVAGRRTSAVLEHNFRVSVADDWLAAVQILGSFMPLLIVDVRETSNNVEGEIRVVVEKSHSFKRIFVTPHGDSRPIVERALAVGVTADTNQIVCVPDEQACVALTHDVFLFRRQIPTHELPLAALQAQAQRSR